MNAPLNITLAQINPIVGDLAYNKGKILTYWQDAPEGTDLVLFPELAICGYPAEDLILKPFFMREIERVIGEILEASASLKSAAIIGTPWEIDSKTYNAALLIENGEILNVTAKHHLPNYGVFDERRIFARGPLPTPVSFRGTKLGIMICEDMWSSDVAAHLKSEGAEILIVPNASPYDCDKDDIRLNSAKDRACETGLPLFYVNQIGGQDELVFDGKSFVLDENATVIRQGAEFEEGLYSANEVIAGGEELAEIYGALKLGLHDYITKNGFPGVLIGLSGGVDSALTAVIAADALGPGKVHCVMMPSQYTSQDSLDDAAALAKNLDVHLGNIPITEAVEALAPTIESYVGPNAPAVTYENIQSRSRGLILMALSNAMGYMVLTTGNKSEMAVGYTTLYGDMCGGFNALKDVYKTQVYDLCSWRNAQSPVIPERIITKAPTAELKDNQTDQDTLPPYDALDDILACLIEADMGLDAIVARGHDRETVARVWKMLDRAEYKRRQAPPGVKITKRSFGRERRYPITNHFVNIVEKQGI